MSRRDGSTTKVFVGSLSASVTTEDLRRLFDPYGKIVECDIANRCGFLHLEDKELAFKAISELNNTNFMGTKISVEKGRVKPPRRSRDSGAGRGGRDRSGPYSYGRDPPRNGMGGYGSNRDYGYGDRYGDYDRGTPVRSYASDYGGMAERRPLYDDRRDFMDDRRGYLPPKGYERRSFDDRGPYSDNQGGYDSNNYDYRRLLMNDRRPMLDQGGGYDRGSGNNIFSRRGDLKPSMSGGNDGYGDRSMSMGGGYGGGTGSGGGYNTMNDGYGMSNSTMSGGYNDSNTGGYGSGGYNDGGRDISGGYGLSSGGSASVGYGNNSNVGYNSGVSTGYDSYNSGRSMGNYDSMYPLQQQRRDTYGW